MTYDELHQDWYAGRGELLRPYLDGRASYITGLLPELALRLSVTETLHILEQRLGRKALERALDPEVSVPSPLAGHTDTHWLRRVNMVGINVRTIGSFWQVIPYSFTLPATQSAIHLLPIWEPGVVASLYGMAGWRINPEFFSPELAEARSALDTAAKQLRAVVNLLHALGRSVGMDVIPHTDRYSEIVLANPHYFEWLRRDDLTVIDHRADLHKGVQEALLEFLQKEGPATPGLTWPRDRIAFFSKTFPEANRAAVLFGLPEDPHGRGRRRGAIVRHLYDYGYEPVPATMGPPYRGLEVNPDEAAQSVDSEGRVWREYRIKEPREMSRVFGPLTRYKFYERLDDNRDWAIDFSRPRREVWDYLGERFAALQAEFGFDFMRGDMSHVQMRPDGVPLEADDYYDPHRYIKKRVQQQAPWFGYFAESFLAGPDFMAYGDEADHLELARADTALGDLQSMVVGSDTFLQHFRRYLDLQATRRFVPCFTIMTGDKDDPRFDEFYLKGNEARLLAGLFLTDLPSYMGLGFETRDPHPEPAPNEHYTKLYVFRIDTGSKATRGPYVWGRNAGLFRRLTRIRELAEAILPAIRDDHTRWLLPPDPTGAHKVIAWTQAEQPRYLFVINLDTERTGRNNKVPRPDQTKPQNTPKLLFSTHQNGKDSGAEEVVRSASSRLHWQVDELAPGEGQVYLLE